MKNKHNDYGKTVLPEVYINALQGHQYIPQSDQCIRNIVKSYTVSRGIENKVLDLGCGPGRLTFDFCSQNTKVLGVDSSPDFIVYADKIRRKEFLHMPNPVEFELLDFTSGTLNPAYLAQPPFDVIVMQGVMHHLHGNHRGIWLKKCHELLRVDGILIVGDEFIIDYNDDDERKVNACKFYLHIIGEALKGGFKELAEEEAKNLIDDVLSGEKGAGHIDAEILERIFFSAELNNKNFYGGGYIPNQNTKGSLIPRLQMMCGELAKDQLENFNRGDLKISIPKFTKEVLGHDFILKEKYEIGPVEQLGGMGVLVFTKK